ncbi:2-phospho-L-lactate transferase [Candidatus Methylomirabilis sp.]|uniref:2-phospho-L-lactate transferase n=1 Tax=Candidatus Methylomirabilis sp. TaxID=2032687 RepID=UPI002A5BA55E|nr:2-phospho-L-lactate transferase [Candidatus Methylomirabilis sp.]
MILALAGGIGGSKLLLGLTQVMDPAELTVIVNTADDLILHGLTICPDLDTVTYTLAGVADQERGWGIAGDTFNALSWLGRYGREDWFHLGDRDLATHLHRTALLREGITLTEATDVIRRALSVRVRILPMSNESVSTIVLTDHGPQPFQAYLVRDGARHAVRGVRFEGIEASRPAPGVLEAIETADGIILCPSNPVISIGPILAVPGIREALKATRAPIVAISPVVGGRSLKGPTDKFLAGLGHEVSALAVAQLYQDFLDLFIVDRLDADLLPTIEALPVRMRAAETVMHNLERKIALAKEALSCLASFTT